MAGWKAYNEHTGEVESGLYDYPFIVRGKPKRPLTEESTVAAFRTKEQADEFIRRTTADYCRGENGFASLHVENWNEEDAPKEEPNA